MDIQANRQLPTLDRALARVLLGLIRGYQLTISRLMISRCRFAPSCSAYAYQAVKAHGAIRGSWLAATRLGRCHPWNPGGWDPVPEGIASRRHKDA